MTYNSKLIKILLPIIVLLAVTLPVLGYYFVLPKYIDFEKYEAQIRSMSEEKIICPFELGKLHLELTWNLRAKLSTDKFAVKKSDDSNFIDIGSSFIEISLPELLGKRVVVKKIGINTLHADITRDKNGEFDVAKVFATTESSEYKVSLKKAEVFINGYRVKFTDDFIKPAQAYLLAGEEVRVNKYTPGKFIEAAAKGKIVFKDKPNTDFNIAFVSKLPLQNVCVSGNITNFEPNKFIPYINNVFAAEFQTIAGKSDINFNLELCDKNKFYVNWKADGFRLQTVEQGLISAIDGDFSFSTKGYFNKHIISVDSLRLKGDGLKIRTSGQIKDYDKENSKLDLKMELRRTRLQQIAKLFPKTVKLKKSYFENIQKHRIKALLSGRVDIIGKADNPRMFGFIDYSDFEMIGGFKNAPKWSGKVDFVGSTITLRNKIYLDKDSFVNVNGSVKPFKSKDLDINITSNEVDFARVHKVLVVLRDFLNLKMEQVFKMKFAGSGRANLNITGKTYQVQTSGYIESYGATIKHEKFSRPVYDVKGKLRFSGRKLYYDELIGFADGMKVLPSGYSSLTTSEWKNGYVDMVLHISDLQLEKGMRFLKENSHLIKKKDAYEKILRTSGFADTKIFLRGPKNDIKYNAHLVFKDAAVLYKGFGDWFKKLKGSLRIEDENLYFDGVLGKVKDSNVKIAGFIKENLDAKLNITSDAMNLKSAKDFLMDSYELKEVRKILKEYSEINGTGSVNLLLEGNLNKNPLQKLTFSNLKAGFNHKLIGIPVRLNKGVLNITSDKVNAVNIAGDLEGINFNASGDISNLKAYITQNKALVPDFNLRIEKFDLAKMRDFHKISLFPGKVRKVLADFEDFSGYAQVYIDFKPKNYNIQIIPDNVSAVYRPYDALVVINRGETQITDKNIKLSSLKGFLSESSFNLNGFINDYKKKPAFDLAGNININANDVKKIRKYSDIPLYAGGVIPFNVVLKGNVDDWQATGNLEIAKSCYLNYIADMGLPKDRVRRITLDAKGSGDNLNIDSLRIDLSDDAQNPSAFRNLININGAVNGLKSKKPVFKNLVIKTNEANMVSAKLFNPTIGHLLNNGCRSFFTDGAFMANLELNGAVAHPKIYGRAAFKNVVIPDYDSSIKSATFDFAKNKINLDILGVNAGKSILNIKVLADAKLEKPVNIRELNINSQLFDIDELSKIFSQGKDGKLAALPPFIVTNGNLRADNLIIKDLTSTNVNAMFNLTPDWNLTVSKINFLATGGFGGGNVRYNIANKALFADFKVKQMHANPLATALLRLPDEVYGTLDGEIKFSTKGKTQQELIANSNGSANFEVYNGRFVRLGSLEYLLRAVNILHSGIGGFNINNVIDIIAPKKTGHFEKLKGRIFVKDGILYTDDITSTGKNLGLYMAGKMDMLTNRADIQILGILPKKISGMLGPIGSLSINEFIDYIPGLGFLPATPGRKGVIGLIPGLDKIPGLELNNKQKYRRFAVQIEGNLYKQESVKSFRWIE